MDADNDLSERFREPELAGCIVKEFTIRHGQYVRVVVVRCDDPDQTRIVSDVELTFVSAEECHCAFAADPWLDVVAGAWCTRDSPLLSAWAARVAAGLARPGHARLWHFHLQFAQGALDVLAPDFVCQVIAEVHREPGDAG